MYNGNDIHENIAARKLNILKGFSEVDNALEKAKDVTMTKKEFVEEHENLVDTLESTSHEDDKEEAKEQQKELDEVKNKK